MATERNRRDNCHDGRHKHKHCCDKGDLKRLLKELRRCRSKCRNRCPRPCIFNANGAGSTLQASFDQAVLAQFNTVCPPPLGQQPFAYNATGFQTGSPAGMNQLLAGQTLFAGNDILPMEAQDLQAVTQKNVLLNFPIALAAVAIGYNLPAGIVPPGGRLKLTAQNLNAIYTGAVTMWNDHGLVVNNPYLAGVAQTIIPTARSDGSGDTAIFTEFLAEASTGWPAGLVGTGPFVFPNPNTQTASGDAGIQGLINTTPFSLGYLAFGFTQTAVPVIPTTAIQNSSGNFIQPFIASIEAVGTAITSVPTDLRVDTINTSVSNGYPMTNPTNIVIFGIQPKRCIVANLRRMLLFFATTGQSLANQFFLGMLPANVLAQFKQNLCNIVAMNLLGGLSSMDGVPCAVKPCVSCMTGPSYPIATVRQQPARSEKLYKIDVEALLNRRTTKVHRHSFPHVTMSSPSAYIHASLQRKKK